MSVKEIKCIYCKGVHNHIVEGDSYICEYCGGLNYITTSDIDFKFSLASNNLSLYKFDEADDIYKNIIEDSTNDKTTSMALMGRILSYFGIVYVKSYGSNVTTPTFAKYNPDISSIKSSRLYKQLCNLDIPSNELTKYKTQIDELDKVYTRIDSDLNETPEYDVFICTKISTKTKDHPDRIGYTEDSRLATDLYYNFREKGLKVFYSDKVLKGVDYDSQIYSALSKSKTILVIASSKEYLESVWVESEWRRWLNFIDIGFRKKDTFLLYLTDKSIEVPSILQKAQVIDYYNIYTTIDSIVNKDKKKEDKNELESIKKELEEFKKVAKNTNNNHVHSFITKTVNPTCEVDGYVEHKCVDCGHVVKENIQKLGHKIEDGNCIRCGYKLYSKGLQFVLTEDGNYEVEKYTGKDTEVIIPESYNDKKIVSIGENAFRKCESLKIIELPKDVTSIGSSAFEGCSSLTNIIIPESVTSIGDSAFLGCTGLTSIIIPDSVTSIGNMAFSGCTGLTNIIIPESVTSIGYSAFYNCTSLTSIVIPDSVTSIGDFAFKGCISLTSITIPESVTSIGQSAFEGCSSLTSIVIPDSVTSIGNYAFKGCISLTSITIPNSVTSIGYSAFNTCSSLTSITIPDSVTSIGNYEFLSCNSLTSIELPEGVRSIGDYAFKGCSSLTSIEIPNSVTYIGELAFYNCSSLTVYCEKKKPLLGYPKGYDKECFKGVKKVIWNYKK